MRRRRDSNPRNVAVQQFSRLPPSTTRPHLHFSFLNRAAKIGIISKPAKLSEGADYGMGCPQSFKVCTASLGLGNTMEMWKTGAGVCLPRYFFVFNLLWFGYSLGYGGEDFVQFFGTEGAERFAEFLPGVVVPDGAVGLVQCVLNLDVEFRGRGCVAPDAEYAQE